MNSTETPGGSGIPAGWYDDPSGEGLRWWDGERWTEHVHTAASAAAATGGAAGEGAREGAPPRDLVKLRESIRRRGAKTIGMVLGGVVLVVVVIALLVSGGSESSGGSSRPGAGSPGSAKAAGGGASRQAQIKRINKQLKNKNLSKAKRKQLVAQKKILEKGAKSPKQKSSGGNQQNE